MLALLAGGGWWFFVRQSEPELSFRTGKIERGALQAAVSATGTVTPVRQVQVGSQVSGQIQELFADFNSEVKEGQLIAQLDPQTYEYRVNQATADLEAARASVLTAQANVQSARINMGYTRITAPISGRIGASSVTPGALVTAQQPTALATISKVER